MGRELERAVVEESDESDERALPRPPRSSCVVRSAACPAKAALDAPPLRCCRAAPPAHSLLLARAPSSAVSLTLLSLALVGRGGTGTTTCIDEKATKEERGSSSRVRGGMRARKCGERTTAGCGRAGRVGSCPTRRRGEKEDALRTLKREVGRRVAILAVERDGMVEDDVVARRAQGVGQHAPALKRAVRGGHAPPVHHLADGAVPRDLDRVFFVAAIRARLAHVGRRRL